MITISDWIIMGVCIGPGVGKLWVAIKNLAAEMGHHTFDSFVLFGLD